MSQHFIGIEFAKETGKEFNMSVFLFLLSQICFLLTKVKLNSLFPIESN